MKNNKCEILVIRLSALGDVAMTIPAIYNVATAYPQHSFRIITTSPCERLFINRPINISIQAFAPKGIQGVVGTFRLLSYIRKIPVDVVADLHNVPRSWMIDAFYLIRGKSVAMLDKMRWERNSILHSHHTTNIPYTDRYFNVFARIGLVCKHEFSNLFANVMPVLPKGFSKLPKSIWIGIAPFARYANKTYPLEQMRLAVSRLAQSSNREVFLFGGGNTEFRLLKEWCKDSPNIHCVAGLFSLNRELELISYLDVMVTMDSANMHLASLAGVRVVSIWGGTSPACGFLGWKQSEDDALISKSSCQPCTIAGKNHCRYGNFHCLTAITPKDIINKVDDIINQKAVSNEKKL